MNGLYGYNKNAITAIVFGAKTREDDIHFQKRAIRFQYKLSKRKNKQKQIFNFGVLKTTNSNQYACERK